jgi:cysteine desulfurase/selenocysteine lyase
MKGTVPLNPSEAVGLSRTVPLDTLDVTRIRADFPILSRTVRGGKPLVYLDNAATTQKPQAVVDALVHYYTTENANVHRGVHELSERATAAFEGAREKVRQFLNAASNREIVFTRNATEAINLVAQTFGAQQVGAGDEVVITEMEHHSNIVPWKMLCDRQGAKLRIAPISGDGELPLDGLEALFNERTKLLAVTHLSNALGTINPIDRIVALAHRHGVPVLVDGSQAAYHLRVDVRALDCDFYAFTGHKLYGPTGIGVLYGKHALLEAMPPYQGGGDMISSVTFDRITYNVPPYKFEAGTPNIAGAVGLGAAIDYVESVDRDRIAVHEADLLAYGTALLNDIPGVRLIGTARRKASILSFVMDDVHPHDIGTIVDRAGVAIRTGHHCAQPLMERYGVPATARASMAMYNTREELDALARAIIKVREVFA